MKGAADSCGDPCNTYAKRSLDAEKPRERMMQQPYGMLQTHVPPTNR